MDTVLSFHKSLSIPSMCFPPLCPWGFSFLPFFLDLLNKYNRLDKIVANQMRLVRSCSRAAVAAAFSLIPCPFLSFLSSVLVVVGLDHRA